MRGRLSSRLVTKGIFQYRDKRAAVVGRAVALWKTTRYSGAGALLDLSGKGHDRVLGSTSGVDANDPLHLPSVGVRHVYMPGASGNSATTPDSAALAITSAIDVGGCFALTTWEPSVLMGLIGQYAGAGARSYGLTVLPTGALSFRVSQDWTADVVATSSVVLGAAPGAQMWVRATWRASDGRVQFFTGSDGNTWTQLGVDRTIALASIFNSASDLWIGDPTGGLSLPLNGKVYRARVYNGIRESGGTLAFDCDFTDATKYAAGLATLTEKSVNGAIVTLNRSATGRKLSVVDCAQFLEAVDDYSYTVDAADLDFAAAESFSVGTAFRVYGTPAASQVLVAKKANLTTGAGYAIYLDTSRRPVGVIADGVLSTTVTGSVLSPGILHTVLLVRDVVADTIRLVVDGVQDGAPVTDTTTGSLANAEELRFGRLSGAGTNYFEGERRGEEVFREALSNLDAARAHTELLAA